MEFKTPKYIVGETKGKRAALQFYTSLSFPLALQIEIEFFLRKMPSEDSKPVVKKEVDSNNKSSVSKKVTKFKKEEPEAVKKGPKVKKEENDDDIPIWRSTSNSKEVKKKRITIKKEEENKNNKKKKEKKVYDLPGQKRDPPEEVCLCFSSLLFALVPFLSF